MKRPKRLVGFRFNNESMYATVCVVQGTWAQLWQVSSILAHGGSMGPAVSKPVEGI